MKKLFKRNQVVITALAIMIAVAGYINYSAGISKDVQVSTTTDPTAIAYDENGDIVSNDIEVSEDSLIEPGTAVLTSSTVTTDLMSAAKLNREQVRASNMENLLDIIDNAALSESAKADAVAKMVEMSDISEREMAAELLLEAKGYADVIVSIVDGNVDVVVNCTELTDTQRAQIEDVVKRKTEVSAENIVITPAAAATVQNDTTTLQN